jgi:isopenicillin-N epimerase
VTTVTISSAKNQELIMLDRRGFLSSLAAGGAMAGLPISVLAQAAKDAAKLPSKDVYEKDEDAYWAELRKQFLIPPDVVYLNNGTVGSSPMPVLQGIIEGLNELEKMASDDPEIYPIWGYPHENSIHAAFRADLAKFVGATRDEIAIVRNATEANSYIANGLEMKAGDEVLMSDQEHPGGEQPWNVRAKRYGIVVKKFEIPKPPKDKNEILNRINDAITPRTRIVFVSHITTVTGVVLPAKEICALARQKGILSALDGAHVPGMMRLDLRDMGCDMYTSSPHKWLFAPKGSGFLYIREEVQPQVWNTIVTEGWDDPGAKAERFMGIGSSNVAMLRGFQAAIKLANNIGIDRIEKRHRKMADYIHAEILKRGAQSWTSPDPDMRCAIATVNVPPIHTLELENWIWKTHKIRMRGGQPSKLRLSTPYYLSKADLDRFLAAFDQFLKLKGVA